MSSGGEYMTREDHEDAHFFAFVAHNTKWYGHDKPKWRKAPTRQEKKPRGIGNPLLSFTEYRPEHGGCSVYYGKGPTHKHDHKTCKDYEQDSTTAGQAYFQAPPPKESQRRSGLRNGKRDKPMEVDMWDQATVAVGGFSE